MRSIIILILVLALQINAQSPIQYSPAEERVNEYLKRINLDEKSLVKNVKFRNVGPTVQSGRVVDIDANPNDPTEFYVAFASGGMWKTSNNGISFEPIFDNQVVMTIGDIAVNWNSKTIYVGTGENNSSRSSYSGNGIYKSTNDGKTWEHLGLAETHRTGRIILHPEDNNIIWAAASGHLYSPNKERGIYKSTDGGKNWEQKLYINENTGAIDLVINPQNPNELYAAMWERERRAWNFKEGGINSGIYKSVNAGETWTLISTEESGFPYGRGVGRIGLAVSRQNPNKIYAFLDNQFEDRKDEKKEIVTKELLRKISEEDFIKIEDKDINQFLDRNDFPEEYNSVEIKNDVKEGKIKPITLVEYLEDANSQLFDTPIKGAELYVSLDAGKTWKKTHEQKLDMVYYTFGYYFGAVQLSPFNDNEVYLLGVPLLKSVDGGKSFFTINRENVHVDHHALWLNPNKKGHLINGNDGGINISYDDGKTYINANTPSVGQLYSVNFDFAEPYNVYGGFQDNGVWVGPSTYKHNYEWYSSGHYPYKSIMGGDGMQIQIDKRDNFTVYTGYQFGNYFRINKETGKSKYITPKHKLGERPFRFNWQTPIHLSKYNQDILYMGSNRFHRSMDKGETWETLSGDLTKGGKSGNVPYGTLTSISESPLRFGLIYIGTDDGLIHVSKDVGYSWKEVSKGLPENYWISRVEASNFDTATVYASLNGYRWDNFESLIYKSTNYGVNWERVGLNIPKEPVNVIKEDPINQNVLYVGTDHALYVSVDAGKTFMGMNNGMPYAPVHDLVIHPRENEIVVGTHGRSIYIADVSKVQALTDTLLQKELHLFDLNNIKHSAQWGKRNYSWNFNESPKIKIDFYSKLSGEVNVEITNKDGLVLTKLIEEADKGLNYLEYDLTVNKEAVENYKDSYENKELLDDYKNSDDANYYLLPGKYSVELKINGNVVKKQFQIEERKIKERIPKKKTP